MAAYFDAREGNWNERLRTSRLGARLGWLVKRRTRDDGRVPISGRLDAVRVKALRYSGVMRLQQMSACRWIPAGPRNINGRIKCLAVDPVNGLVLYAGAADGGVWKTSDGGQSWAPTMHDEASLSIGALAVDPNASNVVYAGTGEPLINSQLGAYAWSYPGAGVYKSTNGAASWTLMSPIPNDYIYRIAVDPFDSTNVFCAGFSAGGTGAGGLCRWDSAAGQWLVVAAGTFSDVVFDRRTAGVLYAARHDVGVETWIKSGGAWAKLREWRPAAPLRINLASGVDAGIPATYVYARLESTGEVFRTTNGVAWTLQGKPPVDLDENGAEWAFRWWCSCLAADPDTPDVIYAGGIDLARSADGGKTWVRLTKAYNSTAVDRRLSTHPDHHAFVLDPVNRARFYAANDGGVFVGTLTGPPAAPAEWQKVSTGLSVTQFYDLNTSAASPSVFGGGCQDNGTLVTAGGRSWRHVYGGDGSYVAFHPTNPWMIWAVRWSGAAVIVQRSLDGGTTFHSADHGLSGAGENPVTVMTMDPADPRILFAGTDRVYRTSNGEASQSDWENHIAQWQSASAQIGAITEITVATSQRIYAGTMSGSLYRAVDGGATPTSFAAVPRPSGHAWPARWLSGITVRAGGATDTVFLAFEGFAAGTSDHVWRGMYDPAANAWTSGPDPIAAGLENAPVAALVIDPNTPTTLYVATDVGVYRSIDDGTSWQPFDQGLPNVPVIDLAIDPVRRLLRAATHGRGAYELRLLSACPEVDLYVRDNVIDVGDTPSPSGEWDPTRLNTHVYHWQSADIKIDAPPYDPVDALIDGVEFDDPAHRQQPLPPLGYPKEDVLGISDGPVGDNQDNRIYVQVHNRGWRTASSVTVRLLWTPGTVGALQLPADFWSNFDTDTYSQATWRLIGRTPIANLGPAASRVVRFNWHPALPPTTPIALLVLVDSADDPLRRGEHDVNVLVRSSKHVALKCVQFLVAAFNRPKWTVTRFQRSTSMDVPFTVRLEASPRERWRVALVIPRTALRGSIATHGVGLNELADGIEGLRGAELDDMDPASAREVAALLRSDVAVCELASERSSAQLHDLLIDEEGLRVALVVTRVGAADEASDLSVDLLQVDGDRVLGGMTFRASASARDLSLTR